MTEHARENEVNVGDYIYSRGTHRRGGVRTAGVWRNGLHSGEVVMMQYTTCPDCGANLDHGEVCDCVKKGKEAIHNESADIDRPA